MSYIISCTRHIGLLFLCILALAFSTGCSSEEQEIPTKVSYASTAQKQETPRDNTPHVLLPEATGENTFEQDNVLIDVSNCSSGYVILTYLGDNEKVKFQIAAPDEVTCTYLITKYVEPIVFPLTGGNGTYLLSLYEAVDAKKDRYAVAFSQEIEVSLTDEFLPFLTPNVYADFSAESDVVSKGMELASECYCELDVIENIYHYVTQSITYDTEKATSVNYGYIPDPNATLLEGTGICFDYASLMTAMLRSQKIPTKLEVGYAGEVYHAWISCYVNEIGWVDNIIEFNGESWSLMDPTLAANNQRSAVQEFIGDGSKYIVKYTY